VGDKFASRHAQKGVCSLLADQEDLPFSVIDGMVPDLIISPCALPSRMTIGQLQESIFGKAAAINGNIADATAFIKHDAEAVRRTLRYFLFLKYFHPLILILIFYQIKWFIKQWSPKIPMWKNWKIVDGNL
jgi:hypothetical protein